LQEIKYIDRQRIIDVNRLIITSWNKRHPDKLEFLDVGIDRIDEVLQIVENAGNELPFEKALMEKAAYLIGGLAWAQAFSGGNKRTALLTCIIFFSQNGYRLNVPQNKNAELRQLLFDIQEERTGVNREIIDKLILYITKYVSKA
jgi:death-on-curing family protein